MATLSSKINELSGLATAAQGTLADTAVQPNDSSVTKAWVNFDGTGTVAIEDSFNVASITDIGVGYYTVNISSNMSNGGYAMAGSAGTLSASVAPSSCRPAAQFTSSACTFHALFASSGGTARGDYQQTSITIHGELA